MSNNFSIQANGLTRSYGNRIAVNDISLTVKPGEVLALLGANGAGKSTTMNMLAGIQVPDEGDISISGYSLKKKPKQARKRLGYLPEQPPVYPELTVNEYLRYCAKLRRIKNRKVAKAVENAQRRCGLLDVSQRLIKNLSKGYQQRVGIAQAIIHEPDIIILDEPTVGLDPVQIIEIRRLIRELGKSHSVILSTHLLPEVLSVCDRVTILKEGKVVHDAPISSFYDGAATLEQVFIRLTCGDVEDVLSS